MFGGAPSACPLLYARMFDPNARWFVAPWDGVKKSFSALLGIFYDIRILRYLYLIKYLIPFYFGNYRDIKF